MQKTEVGKKIRKAMRDVDLTQKSLGEKLGGTRTLVSNWINGYSNPSLKSLKKIASATGKPLHYFFENSSNIQAGNTIYGGETEFNNNQHDFELLQKEIEILKEKITSQDLKLVLILEKLKKGERK
ncbi:MAG: helix-turn-helix transcriptional regulator [Endomicrobium sp.]|jgi:transcriptional regulator with XRE-family HTH domain|nr:helix-turn-helix transcriptional regulator [Endomicrobium sp.]